jgi:uncharacterized membrane protein
MKPILITERLSLTFHIAAMLFGLAGLLLVLPHPDFILHLPAFGQEAFKLSMAGGGVVYIVLGALAVALYGARVLGTKPLLAFLVPSLVISLSSELLGTSTGFPFGHYGYLSGLGYKIAGLVPFTIPLSWFYMGFSCYVLVLAGLAPRNGQPRRGWAAAGFGLAGVFLAALLLTAWDLVLDPAMSQAPVPFWAFQDVGEFFGMPYRNLVGWMGTGAVFIGVGALVWQGQLSQPVLRSQLVVPLMVYLVNFGFGAAITLVTLDHRFIIPAGLGVLLGVVPAVFLWWSAPTKLAPSTTTTPTAASARPLEVVSK